jgi:ferredoxin
MTEAIRVDPIRCRAHGLCAEILPERVTLDDWGYPIVDGEPVGPELHGLAKRAVSACPVFALSLQTARDSSRSAREPSRGGVSRR